MTLFAPAPALFAASAAHFPPAPAREATPSAQISIREALFDKVLVVSNSEAGQKASTSAQKAPSVRLFAPTQVWKAANAALWSFGASRKNAGRGAMQPPSRYGSMQSRQAAKEARMTPPTHRRGEVPLGQSATELKDRNRYYCGLTFGRGKRMVTTAIARRGLAVSPRCLCIACCRTLLGLLRPSHV